MRRLTFDEAAHAYHIDGQPVPSVTQALDRAGLINKEWYTPESRARGKAVHLATQLEDEGRLDWLSLHPEVEPRVYAWNKFKSDTGFQIIHCERIVCSFIHNCAGGFDRLGVFPNRSGAALIDIKSGKVEDWAGKQTAGYAIMIHELTGIMPKRYGLELKADATYRLRPFHEYSDLLGFLDALKKARSN
jgi:hypothetical protein